MSGPRVARGRAHARAALVGNPSDGYGGRTIALIVRNFAAEVRLRRPRYSAIQRRENGLGRLTEAAGARFRLHCEQSAAPAVPCLEAVVETDIPREVGLGGSSAIVIATLRALSAANGTRLEPDLLAEIALAAETEELGIAAGPQDRVVQAREGAVYMDLAPGANRFEQLDPKLLPPLFVAYRTQAAQPSADVHARLRERFERGDPETIAVISEIAELASRAREALLAGDHDELGELMRANVEARARIVAVEPRQMRMVEIADELGLPSNYAGSGGAIVGIAAAERIDEIRAAFARERCEVIVPRVT